MTLANIDSLIDQIWRLYRGVNSCMGVHWSIIYGANVKNATIIQYYVIAALLIGSQATFGCRARIERYPILHPFRVDLYDLVLTFA